jgi:hypothetical protein
MFRVEHAAPFPDVGITGWCPCSLRDRDVEIRNRWYLVGGARVCVRWARRQYFEGACSSMQCTSSVVWATRTTQLDFFIFYLHILSSIPNPGKFGAVAEGVRASVSP